MVNEFIAKAITSAIKAKNIEDTNDWWDGSKFNKGMKLLGIHQYDKDHGKGFGECLGTDSEGNVWMRLLATYSFKPAEKYDNNIVKYEVLLYSDGSMSLFFEGSEYDPEIGKK